ncbi:MAG: esterase-like activity of phytase family protein [Microbacteriaceae bacterium]|nr:esterase-like activity of phytase family protein [Microbacteriaceae bacterium]
MALPAEVADHIRNWGLEGVTATTGADGAERVYVAVQRPLWGDPNATPREALEGENTARIGEYDPATGEWAWFGYELETTAAAGDWIGLSEITAVDERTFAVVERDKRNGPDAAIKRVYTVAIPDRATIDAADGALIPLEKSLAIDVLPMLQATNGWTQEKLEGFTIAADGRVYAVTDNDGLEDANGETVFLRLGDAAQYFDLGGPVDEPTAEPTAPAVDPTAPASGDDATDDAGAPAAGDLASTGAADAQLVALLAAGALLAGAAALLANRARRSA